MIKITSEIRKGIKVPKKAPQSTAQRSEKGLKHGDAGDLLGDGGDLLGDGGDLLGDDIDLLVDGVDLLVDGFDLLDEGVDLLGEGVDLLGDGGDPRSIAGGHQRRLLHRRATRDWKSKSVTYGLYGRTYLLTYMGRC